MITDEQAQHYLFELARETDLAGRLFRRFQAAADTWLQIEHDEAADGRALWTGTEAERDMQEAVEGMLSTIARISLLLFPSGTAGEFGRQRGERLQELTKIDSEHPIRARALRNHWMHLDERFDAFVQKHGSAPVGYYLAMKHHVADRGSVEMLRLLDPSRESVFVLGQEYSLRTLADAAEHVGQQAALAILALVDRDV